MKPKIVQIYEKVQKIPYKICKFEESKVDKNLKEGDCRHKAELLYKLLKKEGYEVKKIRVVFDWKDLPLPKEIITILTHGTLWDHRSLEVKLGEKWIKVDCTWPPYTESAGFPVTRDWNGKSDTLQVTRGELEFYDADKYVRDETKILID